MTTNTLNIGTVSPVEALSQAKNEPAWMLDLRLKAWRFFEEIPWPTGAEETWRRTKLTGFKFEEYQPVSGGTACGVLPADVAKSLAEIESVGTLAIVDGATAKYELDAGLTARGVIFSDLHTAARQHPELVQRYFGAAVATDENKFSALQLRAVEPAARSSMCRATSSSSSRSRRSSARVRASWRGCTTRSS